MNILPENPPRLPSESFQTFDATVRDICAYMGDDEAKTLYIKVARFLRFAVEEMNLYLFVKNVKSVILKVNANMTADLPRDFQTLSKIGVCCGNGKIRLIGRDDSLCVPGPEKIFDCCDCSKGVHTEEDAPEANCGCSSCDAASTFHNVDGFKDSFFGSRFFNGTANYVPYLYGYTPKMWRNGTYRLDERNMRLILGDGCDTRPGSEIIMEYNSSLSDDEYDLIPKKAVPTIMYKTAAMIKTNSNPNAAAYDMNQFKIHYRQLKKTYSTFTLEDFVAAIRGTYKSSPKR
jgi:hypothetical protein